MVSRLTSMCPSVSCADAKYTPRLAFVLMSGLFRHCGVKICFVGLKIGVVGLKKIKGITSQCPSCKYVCPCFVSR